MVGIDGMSPLHLATKMGHLRTVERMIRDEHLQTFTMLDYWKRSVVHLAAHLEDPEILSTLIRKNPQIDNIDEIDRTPIQYLFKRRGALYDSEDENETEDVQRSGGLRKDLAAFKHKIVVFVEIASKNEGYRDNKGRTLLYYAVEHTDIPTIERLISQGYNLEAKDASGMTPLHFAISIGRPKIALKLLGALSGLKSTVANAFSRDNRGYTPLMYAAKHGYKTVVEYIVETILSTAGEEQQIALSEKKKLNRDKSSASSDMEEDQSGILARNHHGQTALHIALDNSEANIAMYLLRETGVYQESPVDANEDSLLVAACQDKTLADCVPSILERWPESINLPDSEYGRTPLSFACELGTEAVVDWLLAFEDLKLNAKSLYQDQQTPLHAAVKGKHLQVVQKLLRKKDIAVNATNGDGETALEMAYDNKEIAKALLVHDQTEPEARVKFFSRILGGHDRKYRDVVHDIIPLVEEVGITDESLEELITIGEEGNSAASFSALARQAFDRGRNLRRPFHRAARLGSPRLLEKLNKSDADPNELDEDGWSCIEYAETYRGSALEPSIIELIKTNLPSPDHDMRFKGPGPLEKSYLDSGISVKICGDMGHKDCTGLHGESENSQFNTY